jgi:hypothetical protein
MTAYVSYDTSSADYAAIVAVALDYAQAGYTGDSVRMEGTLHGQLAKRILVKEGENSRLSHMSALELVQYARDGRGLQPEEHRQCDVRVLDIFGNTASVRLEMNEWIDYLHMGHWNGRWVIVNVLWEFKDSSR